MSEQLGLRECYLQCQRPARTRAATADFLARELGRCDGGPEGAKRRPEHLKIRFVALVLFFHSERTDHGISEQTPFFEEGLIASAEGSSALLMGDRLIGEWP